MLPQLIHFWISSSVVNVIPDAFEVFVAVKFHTFIKLLLTTFPIIFPWNALTGLFTLLAKGFAAGYGITIIFSFWSGLV